MGIQRPPQDGASYNRAVIHTPGKPIMIVERIWVGNALRNYNYLLACPDSGEALAIDPLDATQVLATAKARGWDCLLYTSDAADE